MKETAQLIIGQDSIQELLVKENLGRLEETVYRVSRSLDPSIPFVEVGTCGGVSALVTLRSILESGNIRWFWTVDPYGHKPYRYGNTTLTDNDYGEQYYRNALYSISKYVWENNLLWHHWRMTSQSFSKTVEKIPFWYQAKKVEPKFGFVFLDGEHDEQTMLEEFIWFRERVVTGGVIVIDDVNMIGGEANPNIISVVGKFDYDGRKLYWEKS